MDLNNDVNGNKCVHVLNDETEEDLIKRLNEWKNNVENRGMRVSMNKTKVMISGERQKPVQKAARWPCGVCGRGVGSNSIQCTSCHKWVHKKCSGIKGNMYKVMRSFICRGCSNPVISTGHTMWILVPVQIWRWWMGSAAWMVCCVWVGGGGSAVEARI